MSEEMQTEIEKCIEEAAIEFEKQAFRIAPYEETDLSDAFRAGAKFILELPELREAIRVLAIYSDENNWENDKAINGITFDRPCALARAHDVLETLKKAGLV